MRDVNEIKHVHCLLYGELLAEMGANALAEAMPSARLRHAYRRQAADEVRHANMFRGYLRDIGAEPVDVPHLPECEAYRRLLLGAVEKNRLLTLVLGVNVALEGIASVGLALSAQWVAATGDDPDWVTMLNAIERDERRHTLLATPALRTLGSGVIPREAAEVMGEVREAAVAALSGIGSDLAGWGIDPVKLFDAALRETHPTLCDSVLDPRAAA